MHSFYLYFLGLSLRIRLGHWTHLNENRRYVLSGSGFKDLVHCRFTGEKEYLHSLDETIIHIGNQHFWLWICIEPIHR